MSPVTNMKQRSNCEVSAAAVRGDGWNDFCAAVHQRLVNRMAAVKAAVFAEAYGRLGTQERLLRLALNEAEAVAWASNYPQLIFPTLASEKVQAVLAWNNQQQSLRRSHALFAPAV